MDLHVRLKMQKKNLFIYLLMPPNPKLGWNMVGAMRAKNLQYL